MELTLWLKLGLISSLVAMVGLRLADFKFAVSVSELLVLYQIFMISWSVFFSVGNTRVRVRTRVGLEATF